MENFRALVLLEPPTLNNRVHDTNLPKTLFWIKAGNLKAPLIATMPNYYYWIIEIFSFLIGKWKEVPIYERTQHLDNMQKLWRNKV